MMSMEEMAVKLESLEKKVEELDDINKITRLHSEKPVSQAGRNKTDR